jgi:hypothetical protein
MHKNGPAMKQIRLPVHTHRKAASRLRSSAYNEVVIEPLKADALKTGSSECDLHASFGLCRFIGAIHKWKRAATDEKPQAVKH